MANKTGTRWDRIERDLYYAIRYNYPILPNERAVNILQLLEFLIKENTKLSSKYIHFIIIDLSRSCDNLSYYTSPFLDEEVELDITCCNIMQLLIKNSFKINDNYESSLLFNIINQGCLSCARLSIECGASPESRDYKSRTPLHFAAYYGDLEFFKFLIERGAKFSENDSGHDELYTAAIQNKDEILEFILKLKNVDQSKIYKSEIDSSLISILHILAYHGNTKMLNLLSSDAINKFINYEKGSPLLIAIYRYYKNDRSETYLTFIRELLNLGANIDHTTISVAHSRAEFRILLDPENPKNIYYGQHRKDELIILLEEWQDLPPF